MSGNSQALTTIDEAVTVTEMLARRKLIQDYMKSLLKEGEHYGEIPGCGNKPTLLKAGAEKLCFALNLRHDFTVTIVDDPNSDHRSVRVHCRIFNKTSGLEVGQGLGEASSKETKWRYRSGVSEITDFPVPSEYWNEGRDIEILRAIDPSLKGKPLGTTKNEDGKWFISIKGTKVEHDNPADHYNTVLKIAKKRAMVDATITATACSDIFTQDIEDLTDNEPPPQADPPTSSNPPSNNTETPKHAASTQGVSAPSVNGSRVVTTEQAKDIYKMFMKAQFDIPQMKEYLLHHFNEASNYKVKVTVYTIIKGLSEKGELNPMVTA